MKTTIEMNDRKMGSKLQFYTIKTAPKIQLIFFAKIYYPFVLSNSYIIFTLEFFMDTRSFIEVNAINILRLFVKQRWFCLMSNTGSVLLSVSQWCVWRALKNGFECCNKVFFTAFSRVLCILATLSPLSHAGEATEVVPGRPGVLH